MGGDGGGWGEEVGVIIFVPCGKQTAEPHTAEPGILLPSLSTHQQRNS